MFGNLFQRSAPARLADHLGSLTPERTAQLCETNEGSEHFIALTIGFLIASTAGHFVRTDLPRLKGALGSVNRDVIAFEALVFSAYAVREYFEPLESDTTDELVSEAFKDGFAVCRTIAKRELGGDYKALFERRLMAFAQAHSRGGMRDAAEVFRGILQSIGKASVPSVEYGRPSLSMADTIEAMAVVGAFAATMPKAAAQSLHAIADHYGFF